MYLNLILSIFLFKFLQKSDHTKENYPHTDRYYHFGILLSIGLLIVGSALPQLRTVVTWASSSINILMVYLSYNRPEVAPIKPYVKAFLPLLVINVAKDLASLVHLPFLDKINPVFETASTFAFFWLVAMWIMHRRQEKALETEKQKAIAKEEKVKEVEGMKNLLEQEVSKRTEELTLQKEELLQALDNLKSTQNQLIHAEKMASLGELTAGIAHEIQNPLNFVNNFSEVSGELLDDVKEEIQNGRSEDAIEIITDLKANLDKINFHGGRASSIVKGMLDHSRASAEDKVMTDINALCNEYLRLSYHGLRAKDKGFNASFETSLHPDLPLIRTVSQDLGRVLLNIFNNAFYAVHQQKKILNSDDYEPKVIISTHRMKRHIYITITDNGEGMTEEVKEKLFQPFFTTKPTGEGTGLGMSISYEIVTSGHGGSIDVKSEKGQGSKFTISLPMK